MRVVALLVVACGCRVAATSVDDAAIGAGSGLRPRVVTDAALWSDLPIADVRSDRIVISDLANDRRDQRAAAADVTPDDVFVDVAISAECSLLDVSCVGREGCYPFPFEGRMPAQTRCAFQGVGGPSIPCQSQLDCDGASVCAAPGDPASVCLQRCRLDNPKCPTGFECEAFYGFIGVGVCQYRRF